MLANTVIAARHVNLTTFAESPQVTNLFANTPILLARGLKIE
jgi:hypothetical protein